MTETKTKKNEIKKKDGRGGNHNPDGMIALRPDAVEPGANRFYIALNMELFKLPRIDLKDPDMVRERLEEYFMVYAKYDSKPTVNGMAMALGINRHELWSIATGRPLNSAGRTVSLPPEVANEIKKSYNFLATLWEDFAGNGKMNPVTSIFLGKNHFGYQDKQEHVITPNTRQAEEFSEDEIKARYLLTDDKDD